MMRFRKLKSLGILIIAGCLYPFELSAQTPTPTVSPDPVADIPLTSFDPSMLFYDYSWRSFIALNWPAATGAANRGQPDRTRIFGDAAGPRVWTTWKSRFEIFQPNGAPPSPWTSYDGSNPCGTTISNDGTTISSFTAFGDFNQATFSLDRLGNPLIARNGTYARYEVRINEPQFDTIVANKWYLANNLPTAATHAPFKNGSIEVKAAWRIVKADEGEAVRKRYYVIDNAQVFDVAAGACTKQSIALVGLHIVAKTPSRPQWIWSSFEHVDNVPGTTTEPAPPAGIPLSFNDPSHAQALDPPTRPAPVSPANPPSTTPTPMQVVRKQPIRSQVMDTNAAYWNLPEIKGTVWQNYMLVMTQWPTNTQPEEPANAGDPFPAADSALSNTTMETYFQKNGTSCMDCHQTSNDEGRDFVMFVTFDAFRPSIAAPASDFSAKLSLEQSAGHALADDEMVQKLKQFFEAN